MRVDSILQKLETYLVAAVTAVLVSGIAFVLSSPFSPQDYDLTGVSAPASQSSSSTSPAPFQDSQPALLEPALRGLDGVVYHG